MRTIVITHKNEDSGAVHMPHPATERTDMLTLCGWVDVPSDSYEHVVRPVTCKRCIETFKAIKRFKTPPGYFALKRDQR
jgi:hypothetical protein